MGGEMGESTAAKNKAIVLEAFETLFNKRDYAAAERFWSPNCIQHSAHIAPGREGLFNLIKSLPPTLRYEPGTIVAVGLEKAPRKLTRLFTGENFGKQLLKIGDVEI